MTSNNYPCKQSGATWACLCHARDSETSEPPTDLLPMQEYKYQQLEEQLGQFITRLGKDPSVGNAIAESVVKEDLGYWKTVSGQATVEAVDCLRAGKAPSHCISTDIIPAWEISGAFRPLAEVKVHRSESTIDGTRVKVERNRFVLNSSEALTLRHAKSALTRLLGPNAVKQHLKELRHIANVPYKVEQFADSHTGWRLEDKWKTHESNVSQRSEAELKLCHGACPETCCSNTCYPGTGQQHDNADEDQWAEFTNFADNPRPVGLPTWRSVLLDDDSDVIDIDPHECRREPVEPDTHGSWIPYIGSFLR